jgi:hypothetical protein
MAMLFRCQQWSLPMPVSELRKASKQRYLAKQKALGIKPKPLTAEQLLARSQYAAKRRADAKANGIVLLGDTWFKRNPDRHRANGARWRSENPDRAAEITRLNQAARRSTPWGKINNRMWPIVHGGVRRKSTRMGKYNVAVGYTWFVLRKHLEDQFTPEMTWENWGSYWELDHIRPLSSFKYVSIDDPVFAECWGLCNLRPLERSQNQKKCAKPDMGNPVHH